MWVPMPGFKPFARAKPEPGWLLCTIGAGFERTV